MDTDDGDNNLQASRSRRDDFDLVFFDSEQDIATFGKCTIKHGAFENKRSNSFSGRESNDNKFKLNTSERIGGSHNWKFKHTNDKKVAFAETRSDKSHRKRNKTAIRESKANEDYDVNKNPVFQRVPQTPYSSSDGALLKNPLHEPESTLSTSSILDNEFDEPSKETLLAEKPSDDMQDFKTPAESCEELENQFANTPSLSNVNIPDKIIEESGAETEGPNPNLSPDSGKTKDDFRKDTVVTIPESTVLLPTNLPVQDPLTTPGTKDGPDTIINIPPSMIHIPNRSLGPGRRKLHSELAHIPRLYDPVTMSVIEDTPTIEEEPVTENPTGNSKGANAPEISAQENPTNTTTNPQETNHANTQPSTSETDHIVENEFSLISADGNVLNSPASRHLVSKFGKFVAQELMSQSRGKLNENEKSKVKNVSFSTENLLENYASRLVRVSKYAGGGNELKDENENPDEDVEIPKILKSETVSCRYALSGCQEKLEKGSMHEQDHYLSCKYRPIKCLLAPACNEILCHHNYIPHLMQHFMVPTYSKEIVSTVILTPEDFNRGQTWTPKWFSAYENHFFAVVSRKENGTWSSWVWMLGSKDEAHNFAARITLYKGSKEVSQVFPVHSVHTELEDIETERTCLLVTDETMIELTQVGKNMFSDFSMRVVLIPNAKELNNTIRENRALPSPRSRPLRSEKLYVTTIDALE